MEVVGLILGALGLIGTVLFGIRSKKVTDAFSRYIELQKEVDSLQAENKFSKDRIKKLKSAQQSIFRHYYEPKSNIYVPGDRVKLIQIPKNRHWISENSLLGMHGVIVDYGPGAYEYLVHWSQADYKGLPIDDSGNTFQSFYINGDQIERLP